MTRRGLAILALVGALAIPALAQRRLRIRRAAVARIEGGWFLRGASAEQLELAVTLCRASRQGRRGFERCRPEAFAAETPMRRVYISAFSIDRTEVTVAAWRRCVRAGECAPPRMRESDPRIAGPEHPVTGITWREAQAYCAWAGGQLPTEAQWERAARGPDGRPFPWGFEFNDRLANHGTGRAGSRIDGYRHAAPVGSFSAAVSPYGLYDVSGNVWEWTADAWAPDAYEASLSVDPRGPPSTGERVIRGGSWRSSPENLRVTTRVGFAEGNAVPEVGFRCAYSPRSR